MSAGMPLASLISGVLQSGMVGKIIVLILVVGSMLVWYVLAEKSVSMRKAAAASRRFLTAYRKSKRDGHSPEELFRQGQRFAGSPVYKVYNKCCRALGMQLNPHAQNPDELFRESDYGQKLANVQLKAVQNAANRSVSEEELHLEEGMNLLAIATSTAPFLGLLGTVWGVSDAFTAMAIEGAANLSAVAPGISSALSTTIVGLLVALPSMVGYNLLTRSIQRHVVESDNFAEEFVEDVQHHFT